MPKFQSTPVIPIEQFALNVIGVPLQTLITPPTTGGEVVKHNEKTERYFFVRQVAMQQWLHYLQAQVASPRMVIVV